MYDKNTDIHLTELEEGSYFGDVPTLLHLKSAFKCKTGGEKQNLFFAIKQDALENLFAEFPHEQNFFKERALRRRQFLKKVRDHKRVLFLCSFFQRSEVSLLEKEKHAFYHLVSKVFDTHILIGLGELVRRDLRHR